MRARKIPQTPRFNQLWKRYDNIRPRLLTGYRTATYLGIGYVKLRHLVRDGVLTPVDIGVDKLLFDRLAVDAIISARSGNASEQIEDAAALI